MPRGKELERLPMANALPGAGKDKSQYKRESLTSIVQNEQPQPSTLTRENEDMN
ncbi:hypothetical protein [Neobacillus muris]|uniref:hypothetical protein n=1 Tax=Neobacillus muris TaxID=2941334 RepID=UPI00204123AB|nr:hypothetical protein [Neobacillus muris]